MKNLFPENAKTNTTSGIQTPLYASSAGRGLVRVAKSGFQVQTEMVRMFKTPAYSVRFRASGRVAFVTDNFR